MGKWLRRLRGALGIGVTWATAWAVTGPLLFAGLLAAWSGTGRVAFELVVGTMGFFALSGFVGGATFSVLLGLTQGRRTFQELSLPRFGAWGALAGALTYVGAVTLFGAWTGAFMFGMTAIAAVLGAGSAAGSLALARWSDDGRRLGAGADVAALGPGDEASG